ncbi:hypothetical protein PLICRDRAFT_95749 [Plicaturopsis crispa FD-325 SS-3]|uniref:Uncharacterized protein n=1 Tax=Plicaturopsis crispa FD-325 SS-3 TaxID=944288 RepID=A0A0C9SQH8_PLICR|nr:hypothetical protein PLICRDRAFT_95749 [Plicaturopsis crispa FD-325 SS-3]
MYLCPASVPALETVRNEAVCFDRRQPENPTIYDIMESISSLVKAGMESLSLVVIPLSSYGYILISLIAHDSHTLFLFRFTMIFTRLSASLFLLLFVAGLALLTQASPVPNDRTDDLAGSSPLLPRLFKLGSPKSSPKTGKASPVSPPRTTTPAKTTPAVVKTTPVVVKTTAASVSSRLVTSVTSAKATTSTSSAAPNATSADSCSVSGRGLSGRALASHDGRAAASHDGRAAASHDGRAVASQCCQLQGCTNCASRSGCAFNKVTFTCENKNGGSQAQITDTGRCPQMDQMQGLFPAQNGGSRAGVIPAAISQTFDRIAPHIFQGEPNNPTSGRHTTAAWLAKNPNTLANDPGDPANPNTVLHITKFKNGVTGKTVWNSDSYDNTDIKNMCAVAIQLTGRNPQGSFSVQSPFGQPMCVKYNSAGTGSCFPLGIKSPRSTLGSPCTD